MKNVQSRNDAKFRMDAKIENKLKEKKKGKEEGKRVKSFQAKFRLGL